jgi:hypothetical protein
LAPSLTVWVRARLYILQKECTPISSTTKIGCHEIAEIVESGVKTAKIKYKIEFHRDHLFVF